ncbi:MAG: hypothetical protein IJX81_01300 [Clostridia bacterium]|nr:hypothetical protein [Clostridia bacterium]
MEKQAKIKEIADFLLKESTNANVEPVCTMEDGTEIRLDSASTVIVNRILEEAFIPYLAEKLVERGYCRREEIAKQYHDMLAEEDIECFNDGRDNAYLYTDHLLAINDKIYKELTK